MTADSLQRVIDHYVASDWRAQRVLVTGDLIHDDSEMAYTRFRDFLLPLRLRVHCVPGNHDVRDYMEPVCGRPPFSYCAYEEVGNWLLVGLDSCVEGEAGGSLGREELDRLSETVESSMASHVLVFLHHPPVPMGSAWLDSVGMQNGDEFLERLRALDRVRAVAFGHVHQAYDGDYGGVRILATPSTCRQFLPESDEFATDNRPPAYRRISLLADGRVDTELMWVDD